MFGLCLVWAEPFLPSPYAPRINVRWDQGVSDDERQRLESMLRLVRPEQREGTTWQYDLVDTTRENVSALVTNEVVEDTHGIDRTAGVVSPDAPRGTTWTGSRVLYFWRASPGFAVLAATSAAAFLFAMVSLVRARWPWSARTCLLTTGGLVATGHAWRTLFSIPEPAIVAALAAGVAAVSGTLGRTYRVTATVSGLGVIAWVGILALIGQADIARVAAAGAAVYLFGYVAGSLLVPPSDGDTGLSSGFVRIIVGLLLSVAGYFLCLRFSLPWAIGPTALLLTAILRYGRTSFRLPSFAVTPRWDPVLAGAAAVITSMPILMMTFQMSPGPFPPVFYEVDTPYTLGQVHALVRATTFPPLSLNVVGARPPYHYGIQGIAALISRVSGLAPHHALFLVVLPLLVAGIAAAAVGLVRRLGPGLPWLCSLPLLLYPAPTLMDEFWSVVGPKVMQAMQGLTLAPLGTVLRDYELWGVSNVMPQNVATPFLVLACLVGVLDAPSRGWRLPVFIAGLAVVVKASTAISLLAGLGLVQLTRAITARSLRPLAPAVAAAVIFLMAYALFWSAPGSRALTGLRLLTFHQLNAVIARGELVGFIADVLWLAVPVFVALMGRARGHQQDRFALLIFAAGSFVAANTVVLASVERAAVDDWLQIMISVPVIVRAFVLSVAARRWDGLGPRLRACFAGAVALAVVPGVLAAGRYGTSLASNRANGHEFADNRSMAQALAIIPTDASVIVTNDLRYAPARVGKPERQPQIAALFGHQAFAASQVYDFSYAYDEYPVTDERLALQELLRSPQWTEAIEDAARRHRWTHFLVHKSYPHPATIPLERLFESDDYVVYRFPRGGA